MFLFGWKVQVYFGWKVQVLMVGIYTSQYDPFSLIYNTNIHRIDRTRLTCQIKGVVIPCKLLYIQHNYNKDA